MNACPDKIGTYEGQEELIFPDHMMKENGGYYDKTKSCWVDSCIADEILYLWNQGIVTTGCCCGHGVNDGMINVMEKDRIKMANRGYEKLKDIPAGCWEYTYKPKSKHGEVQG